MPALFKDFNKDAKDLLTKNFQDAGAWKIESKFKGGKNEVYVNPQASNDGVSVDVEYNTNCILFEKNTLKTKFNVNAKGDVKPTLTYEIQGGHKVEAVLKDGGKYEITYEGKFGDLAVHDKLTKDVAEVYASAGVAKHCEAGAGVSYNLSKKALNWSVGVRYADAGRLVSVTTANLQSFNTAILYPVAVAGFNLKLALLTDCVRGGKMKGTAGLETPCILFPKNALRLKVSQDFKWALAYIAPLSDKWKAAVSLDANLKAGVHFTRE